MAEIFQVFDVLSPTVEHIEIYYLAPPCGHGIESVDAATWEDIDTLRTYRLVNLRTVKFTGVVTAEKEWLELRLSKLHKAGLLRFRLATVHGKDRILERS